jgi:hypothetical protein
MNAELKELMNETFGNLCDPPELLEKFAELLWKEAYEQGYDKGMSDGQCGCGV